MRGLTGTNNALCLCVSEYESLTCQVDTLTITQLRLIRPALATIRSESNHSRLLLFSPFFELNVLDPVTRLVSEFSAGACGMKSTDRRHGRWLRSGETLTRFHSARHKPTVFRSAWEWARDVLEEEDSTVVFLMCVQPWLCV